MGYERKGVRIVSEIQAWTKGPAQQILLLGLSLTAAPNVRVFIEPVQWVPRPVLVLSAPENLLAALYAPFSEEDRSLANAGLSDFARMLEEEDSLE
jgi:hypothetical protein